MKAEIRDGGILWIVAENPCEALALKSITGNKVCKECGQINDGNKIIFDASAISKKHENHIP